MFQFLIVISFFPARVLKSILNSLELHGNVYFFVFRCVVCLLHWYHLVATHSNIYDEVGGLMGQDSNLWKCQCLRCNWPTTSRVNLLIFGFRIELLIKL